LLAQGVGGDMDLVDDKDEFGPDKVDELNSAFGKK
jgi:hypothetical protein